MGYGKIHFFLYDNEFTLETDQKPLVSIYQKHLVDVSPSFHIVYVPGKLIPMADALSRNLKKLTSEDEEEDQISLPILAVNYITRNYQQHPDKPLHSRESVFWPGISNDICQTVDKCGIGQATLTAQRKLPCVPSEIPP